MKIGNKTFALVVASVLIGAVAVTNIQQQASAIIIIGGKMPEFKQVTHTFEKNVIKLIGTTEGPEPHLRELLQAYADGVNRIFLGGPDTIPALLQSYERDVTTIFDQSPPEPDKQLKKDFKKLTHNFVKDVIDAVLQNPPEPE